MYIYMYREIWRERERERDRERRGDDTVGNPHRAVRTVSPIEIILNKPLLSDSRQRYLNRQHIPPLTGSRAAPSWRPPHIMMIIIL